MNRPKAKPAAYSIQMSTPICRLKKLVITAATMMPVASPAAQWMVEPTACFHSGAIKASCVPDEGSQQENQ